MGILSTGFGPEQRNIVRTRVSFISLPGNLRRDLTDGLRGKGFHVANFEGLPGVRRDLVPSDVILIDAANLRDPHRCIQEWRKVTSVPLVLLGSGTVQDEIAWLRAGADDYLFKPVLIDHLVERLRARLRPIVPAQETITLVTGDLVIDARAHEVSWAGAPVVLSHTEFRVLEALARHPGHVKSREQLLDVAHGNEDASVDRSIDSHIKRLRKKFREVDPQFRAIETLYGVGYRYVV